MSFFELLKSDPILAIVFLASIVACISVHEAAHAWTANYLGDDTPRLMGRVTLNPLAHLDPFGTIALLFLGFGWGRPVIINPMRLKRRIDELLVALAGPVSNLLFAIFLNVVISLTHNLSPIFASFLEVTATLNLILAAFNLIPIPPLDGSSIVAYFWPEFRSRLGGNIGMILILIIVFSSFVGPFIQPIVGFFDHLTHLFGLIPYLS